MLSDRLLKDDEIKLFKSDRHCLSLRGLGWKISSWSVVQCWNNSQRGRKSSSLGFQDSGQPSLLLAIVLLLQASWTDASKSSTAVVGQVKEIHQCSCLNVTWGRRAHKDELQRAVTSWAAHHIHVTRILCPSFSREPLLVAQCAKSCERHHLPQKALCLV